MPRARAALAPGALHYRRGGGRAGFPFIPLLIAAGIHAFALLGFNTKHAPPAKEAVEVVQIDFGPPPPLEDLEEPELSPNDGDASELPEGSYVPMLADLPSIDVSSSDFVQKMDVSSLQPKPDLNSAKVVTIPKGARQGGVIGAGLKNVFNIADLDRVPEPVYQPAPVFPPNLKRDVSSAKVVVEFIVGTDGKVLEARVVDTTHRGFEDAAVAGVSRWQFRPGMKNGKRVNTRMRVPLLFRVMDDE